MTPEVFSAHWTQFRQQSAADGRFQPTEQNFFKCLGDDTETTGYDPHYVLHTGWAARRLKSADRHVDFGSSMYFASIASAMVRQFIFCDIRPTQLPFEGFVSTRQDLTSIALVADSEASVSCLHVLEHIGLGRYGDRVDAAGDRKAARELSRILAPGGELLIVVPMEEPGRIHFNAHRCYSRKQVIELFPALKVEEFTIINNDCTIHFDRSVNIPLAGEYLCGCWRFSK